MAKLDDIQSIGGDQSSNQFYISFSRIPGTSIDTSKIQLRIDQSFDVPAYTVGEYEFIFMGNKIVRPSKVEETDKHLSLQVRIDRNWELVDALVYWRKMFFNPETGKGKKPTGDYYANDMHSNVRVVSINNSGEETTIITFNYVLLKEIQFNSFDPSGNDPQRMTLNLVYGQVTFDFNFKSDAAKQRSDTESLLYLPNF